MSYQISVGLLQDISRVTLIPQNFILRIESYNHTFLESPSVHLHDPNWRYGYSFIGSQKQKIVFELCSLNVGNYMQVIGIGRLDFREYLIRKGIKGSFETKLVLDSKYQNEILLHLRCDWREEGRSRNQGLKEVKRSQNKGTLGGRVQRENGSYHKGTGQPDDKFIIFGGACESRNFFSFLDPVFKGQEYNFMQPVLK